MVATQYGKSGLFLALIGSANVLRYCAIGSGSGAATSDRNSLIAEVLSTRRDYTARDISTQNMLIFTYDYTSTEMSGLVLREFAVCGSQAKNTSDAWILEGFLGTTFDGTNELQIEVRYETF